jgi:diacylglycerol kinase (ATP)
MTTRHPAARGPGHAAALRHCHDTFALPEYRSSVKTRFIVNARSGRAAHALPSVRAFAAAQGAEIAITQRSGHGAELAREALSDGCQLVVAVGGDGTMNEVASGLIGTTATLGLVPCGSGDGLGRHLGIHGPVPRALDILRHGRPQLIDSGTADGHPFFTAAGLGFEAEIADRFNRLQRRGFARYLSTSFAVWREWQPERCVIEHAGGTETVQAFTLAVANANQYGNDARIAPAARVDDGALDLTVIPPINAFTGAILALRLLAGRIAGGKAVFARVAPRFVVHRECPGLIHTDGELHQSGSTVEFVVRPASLRVMVPR